MQDTRTAEFRHVDHRDPFLLYGNLVFCLVRSWGAAMFFLILAAIPAGVGVYLAVRHMPSAYGAAVSRIAETAAAGGWVGLSIPIAFASTWVRWQRLKHNLLRVSPEGIELTVYPWRRLEVPWAGVRSVRDAYVPDEDSASEFIFDTAAGSFKIDGEDWNVGDVRAAVELYTIIKKASG